MKPEERRRRRKRRGRGRRKKKKQCHEENMVNQDEPRSRLVGERWGVYGRHASTWEERARSLLGTLTAGKGPFHDHGC